MIPHPGNPSISLWAFPQPFFIECSALLSPVPLFAKLAIPVKSLIKNAALSNQPASLLAAVHARLIRLPFPSLWLCCFLFRPFLCHLSFKFFRPAGFSCVPVPVLLSALYAAPAFFGRLALPGFRRFSLCFGFCSAVFLSEFCIVVEQLWFALQNAAKKGYTIDNQF